MAKRKNERKERPAPPPNRGVEELDANDEDLIKVRCRTEQARKETRSISCAGVIYERNSKDGTFVMHRAHAGPLLRRGDVEVC